MGARLPAAPVYIQNRSAGFLTHVSGNRAWSITAYKQVCTAHHRSVHRIVGNDRHRLSVFPIQPDDADLTISRTMRVETE